MATDPAGEISELSSKLASIEAVLGPDAMRKEADELRERAGGARSVGKPEQGQAVTRRLSYLDGGAGPARGPAPAPGRPQVLFELAESEGDAAAREEATRDLATLRKEIASSRSGRCWPASTTCARR